MHPTISLRQAATMRLLSLFILGSFSASAFAAATVPANLEPLPPPPAFTADSEAADEPEITISKQPETTVEEFRSGGKVYMIKVTPKVGAPYYLVDDKGDGKFARQESLDSGFRPPRWIIKRF
jgi:hypothetical protein